MLAGTSAMAADELHLYNWNNYIAPETVKQFESGVKCKDWYRIITAAWKKCWQTAAGAKGYDLLVPTGFALEPLLKQGKLAGLDKTRLPNLKNISRQYLEPRFDKGQPVFGAVRFHHHHHRLQRCKPEGWCHRRWLGSHFDPKVLQKIKGKVTGARRSARSVRRRAEIPWLSGQHHRRGTVESGTEGDPAGQAILGGIQRPELYQGADGRQHLGSARLLERFSRPIGMPRQPSACSASCRCIPKEGASLSLDSMVLLKNAPRRIWPHQIHQLHARRQNSAVLTNMTGSGNPNSDALKYVKPD